jgi:hypothetical protein
MAIPLAREPLADIDTVCGHACVVGNILCPRSARTKVEIRNAFVLIANRNAFGRTRAASLIGKIDAPLS